ncbi:MAG TPA: O-antigen ligase family protein [Kiritimatiellia bacterium]|nr:O-antigen ligase family protein [Kiritimatiellia bacterium]
MDVVILFLVGMILARHTITKEKFVKWRLSHYMIVGFFCVLLIVIAIRGIGIRFLGSSEWGGFTYIKIFISIAFYLVCGRLRLSEKHVKMGLVLMLLLSTFPAVAQAVFYFSGGTIFFQYMFLEAYASGMLATLDAMQRDAGAARFYFTGMAGSLVIVALAFFPLNSRSRVFFALFWLTGFFVTLLSGFRAATVGIVVTTLMFLWVYYPTRRGLIMTSSVVAFVGLLIGLAPFINNLPTGVQRALSWVPWYDIPLAIKMDAAISTEWRLIVWQQALRMLPEYLLLGRGLTFNASEVQAALALRDTVSWAYLSHNYHNGPLAILITTGIPGAVIFIVFTIAVSMEAVQGGAAMRRQCNSPFLVRVYLVFMVYLLYAILSFFLIYGDMNSSVPNLLFLAATLQVLRLNFAPASGAAVVGAEPSSYHPLPEGQRTLLPHAATQALRGSAS